MNNKRQLHHYKKILHHYRPLYFVIAFIISLTVSAFALRQNNLHMLVLKNDVTQADKSNGNVELALRNLREYVYAHMNTDLASGPNPIYPPIQLKYTYDRLVQAEEKQVNAINAKVYTEAQQYCQKLIPNGFSGRYRVSCIQQYVTTHGAKPTPIPSALYKFDFSSPAWSPDFAGWSLIVSALLFIVLILRLVVALVLKRILA